MRNASSRLVVLAVGVVVAVGLGAVIAVMVGAVGIASAHLLGPPASENTDPAAQVIPPSQVVLFDRLAGTSRIVSHDASGVPGNLSSSWPSVAADGSAVAFESDASLAPGDTNGSSDIYQWSASGDRVQRISLGRAGAQANGPSHAPSISGDGFVVAFVSTARNLTGDAGLDGVASQVFAWRPDTGSVALVSVGFAGGAGSGPSGGPSVSQDGRIVAFDSGVPDLVLGDSNGSTDVFLRNLPKGVTIRASLDTSGREVTGPSQRPSVSADGRAVAFDSTSSALVRNDSNGARDVFVRDLPLVIQAAPNPVDFGTVALGVPSTQFLEVLSIGWAPVAMATSTLDGPSVGDFVVADDGCAGLRLDYGDSCLIAVLDVPLAPGSQSATLALTDSAPDSPQLVALIGEAQEGSLLLMPAVGPPGIVTTATGSGFPPGALVTLRWDRGIAPLLGPVSVGPDGTFTMQVLVFHNDVVGPRELVAVAAPGGPAFPEARASFLVVQASLQPLGTEAIRFLAPELILRR